MHQKNVSHNPSEIILICWFAAQETFIIINVENMCAVNVFVEAYIVHDSWTEMMNRKFKKWQLYLK